MEPWAIGVGAALGGYVLVLLLLVLAGRGRLAREVALLVPNLIVLFRGLLGDREVPRRAKVALVIGGLWIASPIDLIPDFLPVIGALDDAVVAAIVLWVVVRTAGRAAVMRHWRG